MGRFLMLHGEDAGTPRLLRVNEDHIESYEALGNMTKLHKRDVFILVKESPEQIDEMIDVLVRVEDGDVVESRRHLTPREAKT